MLLNKAPAMQAQEALLGVVWGSAVLALSSCKPLISDTTHTVGPTPPNAP